MEKQVQSKTAMIVNYIKNLKSNYYGKINLGNKHNNLV